MKTAIATVCRIRSSMHHSILSPPQSRCASSSPLIPLWEQDLPKDNKQYPPPPSSTRPSSKAVVLGNLLTAMRRDMASVAKTVQILEHRTRDNTSPSPSPSISSPSPPSSSSPQSLPQLQENKAQLSPRPSTANSNPQAKSSISGKEISQLTNMVEKSAALSGEILYAMGQVAGMTALMEKRIASIEDTILQQGSKGKRK